MQLKNFLVILITALLFSGCFWDDQEVLTIEKVIEKKIVKAPRPAPVDMIGVQFNVVTEENVEQFRKDNVYTNGELVFIAMSVKDYENLSLNMSELKRYIDQSVHVIKYYEKMADDQETDKKEK